jgi:hypothetical protein
VICVPTNSSKKTDKEKPYYQNNELTTAKKHCLQKYNKTLTFSNTSKLCGSFHVLMNKDQRPNAHLCKVNLAFKSSKFN